MICKMQLPRASGNVTGSALVELATMAFSPELQQQLSQWFCPQKSERIDRLRQTPLSQCPDSLKNNSAHGCQIILQQNSSITERTVTVTGNLVSQVKQLYNIYI